MSATYIDTKTGEIHCPTCKERCKIPIPCPSSVLGRFLNEFDRHHRLHCGSADQVPNAKLTGPEASPVPINQRESGSGASPCWVAGKS